MRSGWRNPGAIPLIALVIAMLFAVTPILCERWRGYPNNFRLGQSNSVEGLGVQYQTRDPPTAFTSRFEIGGGLRPEKTGARLSGEAEIEQDRILDRMVISKREKFRQHVTSVIQLSHETFNSTITASLSLRAIISDSQSQVDTGYVLRLWETWQQVCQRGMIFLRLVSVGRSLSPPLVITSDRQTSPSKPPATNRKFSQSGRSPSRQISNPDSLDSPVCLDHVAEDTKFGGVASASGPADRQGSLLAILVSLVVGIIWF